MRWSARISFCLLWLVLPAFTQESTPPAALWRASLDATAPASAFTLRRQVSEVALQFTATGPTGEPVTGLTPQDVLVYDGQSPIELFTDFRSSDAIPLRVALLVDWSASLNRVRRAQQEAAAMFVRQVLRPDRDQALVMVFGGHPQITQDLTADQDKLLAALHPPSDKHLSAVYDAVVRATQALAASPQTGPVRRVLILLSDGADNYSMHSWSEAVAAVEQSDVVVYTLTLHSRHRESPGDAVLHSLAEATGGRAAVADNRWQVAQAFGAFAADLRAGYTLAFKPTPGAPGYRQLEVVAKDRRWSVRARHGYLLAPQ